MKMYLTIKGIPHKGCLTLRRFLGDWSDDTYLNKESLESHDVTIECLELHMLTHLSGSLERKFLARVLWLSTVQGHEPEVRVGKEIYPFGPKGRIFQDDLFNKFGHSNNGWVYPAYRVASPC